MPAGVDQVECIVIGAGAIGLAVARRLACDGREVMVLERAGAIGTESSSRNNEVVHAGLYYRPGGPQAVLCVAGKRRLEAYCAERGVPIAHIGKLVVANDDDEAGWLEATLERARTNGVAEIELLGGNAARRLEPALRAQAALHSPRTAIVDTHALMLAYQGEAEAHGAAVVLHAEVRGIAAGDDGYLVDVADSDGAVTQLACQVLVNAAGIWATPLARTIAALPASAIPHIHLAKGAFFSLAGASPFARLIVPAPRWHLSGGIYTLDLAGQGRFGPDVEWVDQVDYIIDPARAGHFYEAVRRYYPDLPDNALAPAYTGIRSRLNGPGEEMADWILQGPAEHGLAGLVNLFGVESPGITSSLAIADMVADMAAGASFATALDTQRATLHPA